MTISPVWQEYLASDFCESVRDGTHDSPKFQVEGHPLVTSKAIKDGRLQLETAGLISERDFQEINKRSKVDQWDILFTMIGTLGEVYLEKSEEPNYAIKNIGLFKCGDELKARWLYHWFNSPDVKAALLQFRRGASQQYLSLGTLRSLPVSFPDDRNLAVRIVQALSTYDDLIENNRRQIALLEEAARQLYKEWFVRFRFPGHEHVQIIDGVPEGWEEKEIGEVADDVSYGYTASADPNVEGPKFLRITDIVRGQISWPDVPQCPITEHKTARFALSKGDVVVARTGATTGWARRIGRIRQPAVFASYLVRFRFGRLLNPVLAAIFMESDSYKGMVWAGIGGAAQPNASAQLLAKPKLLVPTADLQASFASEIEPHFQMVDVLMEQIHNLSLARDLLLPKLMSGAIAV